MYHYPNYGCGGGPELHGVLIADAGLRNCTTLLQWPLQHNQPLQYLNHGIIRRWR